MKKILKFCIYFLPRNPNIWITGNKKKFMNNQKMPGFNDNSKYFYLYLKEKSDKEVWWITEDKELYITLKKLELPVLYKYSLKGVYKALRGKYYFSHYGYGQVSDILESGSVQINLWHGIPLKKIGYDYGMKKNFNLIKKIFKIEKCEYFLSSSNYLTEKIFKTAFLLNEENYLNLGYPRTDIFKLSKSQIIEFCKKYSNNIYNIIKKISIYNKVLIYMPTWREGEDNNFKNINLYLKELNNFFKKENMILLIKLHPLTNIFLENLENIIVLENDIDIYPILPLTDCLITDYSSVFFDYLLLNKEIIFFPFDKEKYLKNRELYFEYNLITPGIKIRNFLEIKELFKNKQRKDEYFFKREEIRKKIIENYDFDACEKIINFFHKKEKKNYENCDFSSRK